jgi:hypothetical protein
VIEEQDQPLEVSKPRRGSDDVASRGPIVMTTSSGEKLLERSLK